MTFVFGFGRKWLTSFVFVSAENKITFSAPVSFSAENVYTGFGRSLMTHWSGQFIGHLSLQFLMHCFPTQTIVYWCHSAQNYYWALILYFWHQFHWLQKIFSNCRWDGRVNTCRRSTWNKHLCCRWFWLTALMLDLRTDSVYSTLQNTYTYITSPEETE